MLVGQQRVVAPAGLVEGPVDDPLGRLSQLVLRDIEVLHGRLPESNPADVIEQDTIQRAMRTPRTCE